MQAKKEMNAGIFYMHKEKYKGAAARFREATKWNPNWTEAYLRLAEAQMKLRDKEGAHKTLEHVIQLAPDSKDAKQAKKLIAKL